MQQKFRAIEPISRNEKKSSRQSNLITKTTTKRKKQRKKKNCRRKEVIKIRVEMNEYVMKKTKVKDQYN